MERSVVGRAMAALATVVVGVLGVAPVTASAADDTTPPVLHGISFSASSVTAPGKVTATLDATDDVGVVSYGVFVREVGSLSPQSTGSDTSTIDHWFGSGSANGTYRVEAAWVSDAAQNYAVYRADGTLQTKNGPSGQTHDVDLTSPSFTVSGASDRSPPVLHSLSRNGSVQRSGVPVLFTWRATDTENPVASVSARWVNTASHETVTSTPVSAGPGSGTLTVTYPHAGPWLLDAVEVRDTKGNLATYRRDGTFDVAPSGTGKHGLDLTALDATLAQGAPRVTVIARPGRLSLVLEDIENTEPTVVTAVRVVAQPSGVVRELPIPLAEYRTVDLTGLPNGVTQTLSVTLLSPFGDSPTTTSTGRPVLSRNVTGVADVDGDGRTDVLATPQFGVQTTLQKWVYQRDPLGGLRSRNQFSPSVGPCASIAAAGPNLGPGELLCRTDELVARSSGGGESVLGTRGWSPMQWVDGGFSLNGDAYPDVITMNPKGELLLYPTMWTGRLLSPIRIGTGWQSMISVISAGDLNGDRRNDIAAVDASGRLWLYPGNGKGGVTTRRQIGSGWNAMGALLPLRDFDGDGRDDLGGITAGGDLRLYRGTGTGGVKAPVVIGRGWQTYF